MGAFAEETGPVAVAKNPRASRCPRCESVGGPNFSNATIWQRLKDESRVNSAMQQCSKIFALLVLRRHTSISICLSLFVCAPVE